ncbi:MAG: hypothetical protein JNG84_14915 [Archangium sp.]|nr:hypothetical protein [Archangium sp.]
MSELTAWVWAFACTQAIEVPLYLRATGGSWRVSWAASMLTHPVVWFAFPHLCDAGLSYGAMVAAAEAFAVTAETWWLHRAGVPRALVWSLLANAASATTGLVLRDLFGMP